MRVRHGGPPAREHQAPCLRAHQPRRVDALAPSSQPEHVRLLHRHSRRAGACTRARAVDRTRDRDGSGGSRRNPRAHPIATAGRGVEPHRPRAEGRSAGAGGDQIHLVRPLLGRQLRAGDARAAPAMKPAAFVLFDSSLFQHLRSVTCPRRTHPHRRLGHRRDHHPRRRAARGRRTPDRPARPIRRTGSQHAWRRKAARHRHGAGLRRVRSGPLLRARVRSRFEGRIPRAGAGP